MRSEQAAAVASPDGLVLEARLALPASPAGGLVACHPHPLYGGDMDNPVVVRLVEVAAEEGLGTLRFNFRGAGGSTGNHDGGRAEQEDVGAALDHLAAALPSGAPVLLAGYSFGATVSAAVAVRRTGLAGLLLVAPPIAMRGTEPFLALGAVARPVLLVAGSDDEYCPRRDVEALASGLPEARLTVIEGANHFFLGKLFPLGETVRAWLRTLEARQPGGRGRAG